MNSHLVRLIEVGCIFTAESFMSLVIYKVMDTIKNKNKVIFVESEGVSHLLFSL